MKKAITTVICVIALCTLLSGCGARQPIVILLEGSGINLTASSEKITAEELENKLQEITLPECGAPLFESVSISENTGIFYNSYRFMATTSRQDIETGINITVTMSGSPSGVRNGAIEEDKIIFPIEDMSEEIELVAEFEENNYGVIFGIAIVLVIFMAGFAVFIKRGNGSGYGSC